MSENKNLNNYHTERINSYMSGQVFNRDVWKNKEHCEAFCCVHPSSGADLHDLLQISNYLQSVKFNLTKISSPWSLYGYKMVEKGIQQLILI